MSTPRPGRGDWNKALRESAPYLGLGTTLAGTLLLGIAGGHWLDRKWGTQPAWLIVGAVAGMAAAFYHMFKVFTGPKR